MALFHAHCHLEADPVEFETEGSQVFYDDGNDYLIVYRDGTFTITSLADRSIAPQAVDFLRRAPVLGVRFSLDKRHICIQRSHTDIDVVSLQDGAEISYSCKGKGQGNMLHGVVWTNDTLWDLVLVTMQGLELLKLADGGGSLKLVKHDRRAIHWHSYLHSNRLLALCSGKDYATVQCFQLMPDKLLKLPDFDPEMPPPPSGRRSRLDKASIVLCKLYDKLCCIHVNAARQEMVIYQLGRAAIGRLCTVNLFSASDRYALSVTDNLIAVHNTDARITMLFDAWLLQWSSHPVAAPLPLGGPPAPGAPDGELRDCVSAEPLIEDWTFEQPAFLLDRKAGRMWRVAVSLPHLCESTGDRLALVRCLLQRANAARLTLKTVAAAVTEREPLPTVAAIFRALIESGASPRFVPPAPGKWWFYEPGLGDEGAADAPTLAARLPAGAGACPMYIGQGEVLEHVFQPILAGDAVDQEYLLAVLVEYLRALSARAQMAEPFVVDFVLKLILAPPPKFHVLHQLLQYHVLHDSLAVASRLLAIGPAYPSAEQLALDMLHRLRADQELVEVLLERGRVIEALRFIKERSAGVKVAPAALLDAARATGDAQVFATAFRFVLHSAAGGAGGAGGAVAALPRGCEAHEAHWRALCESGGVAPVGT